MEYSPKQIRLAIFGPIRSGKTTLLDALRRHHSPGNATPIPPESPDSYTPTAICECARLELPELLMDLEAWETSGNASMTSVYRRFFAPESTHAVDVVLVVVDAGHSNISLFEQWHAVASAVATQRVVVVINDHERGPSESRARWRFTPIESHCIRHNLYHVRLDVREEHELILQLVWVQMFSSAEFEVFQRKRGGYPVVATARYSWEPELSSSAPAASGLGVISVGEWAGAVMALPGRVLSPLRDAVVCVGMRMTRSKSWPLTFYDAPTENEGDT